MNILFISISWPLPGGRNLYTDLMDEFVLNGHNVCIAANQNIDKHIKTNETVENGITVLRIYTGQVRKTSYYRKMISLLSLSRRMWVAIKDFYGNRHFDLIIGPTPPITLSSLFIRLKHKFRAPFYLLLKDIWPQGSVDHKVIRKYGIPWIYLRVHEIRLYKTADYIGCMSPLGVKYLLANNNFISKSKVEVCPNSIRPTHIARKKIINARLKYNIPAGACIFLFSGNLGIGHGLHFLIEAIRCLSEYSKAFFIVGGSGTHYKYLKKEFDKYSPKNALLYSWMSREDFEQILEITDVGLIFLYRYTSPQFPSRLLSYLDYSKPVLCAVSDGTDIGKIVESANCGCSVTHGNLDEFIKAIRYISEAAKERETMGKNGRKLLLDKFTVTHSYEIIMRHFSA